MPAEALDLAFNLSVKFRLSTENERKNHIDTRQPFRALLLKDIFRRGERAVQLT